MFVKVCLLAVLVAPVASVDCVMSQWGAWSACSEPCSCGLKQRVRTVQVEPAVDPNPKGLSTLLYLSADSLSSLVGDDDPSAHSYDYRKLQAHVETLGSTDAKTGAAARFHDGDPMADDGSTKGTLAMLGIKADDKLLAAIKAAGGVEKLLLLSDSQLEKLEVADDKDHKHFDTLKRIQNLDQQTMGDLLDMLKVKVNKNVLDALTQPVQCPYDSAAQTCNCEKCAKPALRAASAHGFTPDKFTPKGGFPSDFGEQAACILDKGEAVLDLLVAINTCSAWGGKVGTICYKESIGHLHRHAEMCCEGREHFVMWTSDLTCEKAIAPFLSRLTKSLAGPFHKCVSPVGTEGRRSACSSLRALSGYNIFAELLAEATKAAHLLYQKGTPDDMTPAARDALKLCMPKVRKKSAWSTVLDLLQTTNHAAASGSKRTQSLTTIVAKEEADERSFAAQHPQASKSCRLHIAEYVNKFDQAESLPKDDTRRLRGA